MVVLLLSMRDNGIIADFFQKVKAGNANNGFRYGFCRKERVLWGIPCFCFQKTNFIIKIVVFSFFDFTFQEICGIMHK